MAPAPSSRVTPRTLTGFPEWLPAKRARELAWIQTIGEVFERFGFPNIETPVLEYSEILLAKGGEESDRQIYRFMRGQRDVALPFDLTIPLARYVAQHEAKLSFPFRRYQIQRVCRGESAQIKRGRFRMFYQCDVDVIGSKSSLVDAEIVAVIYEVFKALGLQDYVVRVNNRKLLSAVYGGWGISEPARVLRVMDKLEKMPRAKLAAELQGLGIEAGLADKLFALAGLRGRPEPVLAAVRELAGEPSEALEAALAELEALGRDLDAFGVPEAACELDISIARGLDYYTGTVYETALRSHPDIGSICSGGRYDDLASYYTKTALPGVGISIGLSRVFDRLYEAGVVAPGRASPAQVMVARLGEPAASISLAAQLRAAGLACELFPDARRLKHQLKYAQRQGIRFVALMGENELAAGEVAVRDLAAGSQEKIPQSACAAWLQTRMAVEG